MLSLQIGLLSKFNESVYETDFNFFELLAIMLIAESVKLANGLPHLGIQHVFDAVLSPEWQKDYLPGMSLEMRAQRFPWRTCSYTSLCS